jgi:hypothetical protein
VSKRSPVKQSRRHVWLYDEDWEWIKQRYSGTIGPSEAVRKIIHTMVLRIKQQEQHAVEASGKAKLKGE